MSNIYVRVPHYVAAYLRNIEEDNPSPMPFRIERGDPLADQIRYRATANLRNAVSLNCFSERQWQAMLQGRMLTYSKDSFAMDQHRDSRKPLTLSEIYSLCDRTDLVLAVEPDGSVVKYEDASPDATLAPDSEYQYEYVSFRMPNVVVRDGKEVRVQSDWYIPNPIDFISELRRRFHYAFIRYVSEDRAQVRAIGVNRTKMESIDRFMLRYDIRTGDKERENLKKLLSRSVATAVYSLENDIEHGRWSDERMDKFLPRARGRKKRQIFCYDNGQTYDSVSDFAKAIGISKSQVVNAIRDNHRCHGLKIDYVDVINQGKD